MSTVYMISDCHFGHRNILKYRKDFSSVEEHDNLILENILSTTTKRDTLWMLGDMFFDSEVLNNYGNILRKHVGYCHLILGNHDTDNAKRAFNVGYMWNLFDSVRALYPHKGAWLSHCPLHPSELRGKINIHGHVHTQTIPDERYVNVCCENTGYAPVKYQDILQGWRGNV